MRRPRRGRSRCRCPSGRVAEPIQLVAGGSGIVPLMSMIRSRLATQSAAPFRLLYLVRSPDRVWYRDDADARRQRYRRHAGLHAYRSVTAHSMYTASRWRRARAEVESRIRCRVRSPPRKRARDELFERVRSTVDVSANQIGVVLLERRWRHDMPRQEQVAEARCETLDLPLDA
jgi:hypothetical protein